MSRENVEAVQRAVEAWNADDLLNAFWPSSMPTSSGTLRSSTGLEGKATVYFELPHGARKIWGGAGHAAMPGNA